MVSIEYISGFFDGEGSIGIYQTTNKGTIDKITGTKKRYRYPLIAIGVSYKKILEKIYNQLNIGTIKLQKYKNKQKNKDGTPRKEIWIWKSRAQKDILKFINLIRPYSIDKAEQLDIVKLWIEKQINNEQAELKLKELKKQDFSTNSKINIPLKQLSIEYIAGIFDGEGSIGIYQCRSKKWNSKSWHLKISIQNSNKYILDCINYTIKLGSVYTSKRNRGDYDPQGIFGKKCKQGYKFQILNRNDIQQFLFLILPHLHEKKEQAQIALNWLDDKLSGEETSIKLKSLKQFEFATENEKEAA